MTENAVIVYDAFDCEQILDALYKGKRPEHVHTLLCSCGATADLRQDPGAWNQWMILPHARCPACLQRERARQLTLQPMEARRRYLGLLQERVR